MNNDHKNKVVELAMGGCWCEWKYYDDEYSKCIHCENIYPDILVPDNPDYFSPDNWNGMGRIVEFIDKMLKNDALYSVEWHEEYTRQYYLGELFPYAYADRFYNFIIKNKNIEPFASNERLQEAIKEVD